MYVYGDRSSLLAGAYRVLDQSQASLIDTIELIDASTQCQLLQLITHGVSRDGAFHMMMDDDTLKQLLRINDGLFQVCKMLNESAI